ncbi:MAG TPA: hypothetical protein DHV48_10175 [Prolixibacteraceae bacterium]|nr:hypothetical protein [Prolixibacteraceae bacterium]
MILERTKNEILIRLPANIELSRLQTILDYLEYLELTSKSLGKESEVIELSQEANKSMWQKIKEARGIQ